MDQFRAEWENVKRLLERQITLLEPPADMRTTSKDRKDTTNESKERIRPILNNRESSSAFCARCAEHSYSRALAAAQPSTGAA